MAEALTDTKVKNLKAEPRAYTTWDSRQIGFGIKSTPTGRKFWRVQLKFPGHRNQTKRTLGTYPALSLADTRKKAGEWCALVKQEGIDPKRQEEATRRAAALADASTFAAFAERYISRRSNRRAEADAREIRRTLIKEWGSRPIRDITARDVKDLISKLIASGVHFEARSAYTHAVQIFKAAVFDELISVSPCASVDKKLLFKDAKLSPRQRFLNNDELRAFWRAAERLGYPDGPLYRLLLLTACRKNERRRVGAS